jgi:hypothetical protein
VMAKGKSYMRKQPSIMQHVTVVISGTPSGYKYIEQIPVLEE